MQKEIYIDKIKEEIIEECYYLFLNQFYLLHVDINKTDIRDLNEKLFNHSIYLDEHNISYAKQNLIAYLATKKDYYYQNSETKIKNDIKEILKF